MKRKPTTTLDFTLEDELLSVVKKRVSVQVIPKKTGKVLKFTKFQVGMIIPDFVVLALKPKAQRRQSSSRIPSLFECAVLAELIRHGPKRLEEIASKFFARESNIAKAVNCLVDKKLLVKNNRGKLAALPLALLHGIKVISVEAKLRRWKQAIEQAKCYRTFSNCSYVALPETMILKNNHIQTACAAVGVGLISVNRKTTRVLLKPKDSKPISAEWVWLVSKATAKRPNKTIPQMITVRANQ